MQPLLVPVDFSPVTEAQLEQAARLAGALQAPLFLLHVEPPAPDFVGYEPGPQHVRDTLAHETVEHHAILHALRDRLRATGLEVHALVFQGDAVEKILSEAERLDVAMIIIGAHRHSPLRQWLFRGAESELARSAPRPILLVPAPPS